MAGELSFSETVFKVIILSSIVMSLTLNPTVVEAAEIGVVTTDKLKEKSVSHTGGCFQRYSKRLRKALRGSISISPLRKQKMKIWKKKNG